MDITREQVQHIAALSRLRFSDAELDAFLPTFARIVAYVEQLDAVDVSGLAPTTYVTSEHMPLRADAIAPSLDLADALANAPDARMNLFAVPSVMDE